MSFFAILGALNFVDLGNFHPLKSAKLIKKSTFLACVSSKMSNFALLGSPELIARKM